MIDLPEHPRIAPGLRIEDLGREVVVLDPVGGRVHRLTGPAAVAFRALSVGDETSPALLIALRSAGILTSAGSVEPSSRRAVLAAASLGVVTSLLPASSASASPAGLSPGGSAYLQVAGAAEASDAVTGQLQHVIFTRLAGPVRSFTPSAALQVEVLVVGGGGGAGTGGGGGGQVVRRLATLDPERYDVEVAVGGDVNIPAAFTGGAGGTSSIVRSSDAAEVALALGGAGGSIDGPGGSSGGSPGRAGGSGGTRASGGGGGGAGGAGFSAAGDDGGRGGVGQTVLDFIVPSVTYGGGGGGGSYWGTPGDGGAGGGGEGAQEYGNGQPGVSSTGGGGGGSTGYGGEPGRGGSGIVLVRYYGAAPV